MLRLHVFPGSPRAFKVMSLANHMGLEHEIRIVDLTKGEERFHRCAEVLDGHLASRRFITGDALTVADFSIGAPLNVAPVAQLPVSEYEAIQRWHAELCELPAWRKTLAAQ